MTQNPNQMRRFSDVRTLESIPHRPGHDIVGIKKDGTQVVLRIYVDDNGFHTVAGAADLVGWKLYR